MPLTKVFIGITGDFTLVTNWQRHNLRNGAYRWQVSGSGTNEYYVRNVGGTNPEIVATPPTSGGIYVNGVAATKGTLGSLAAGEWGYGDNDTLGYSTIYVRLADGADPDAKTAGWVEMNQVPQAAEHVIIRYDATAISSNVDYSAVSLGTMIVERSTLNRAVGSRTSPWRLTCSKFVFEGGGQTEAFIDLADSAIAAEIRSTASVASDEYGLYLGGSAITIADLRAGSIGLGIIPALPFTCTSAVRTRGSSVRCFIGSLATVPLLEALGGTTEFENSIANVEIDGGTVHALLAAAVSGAIDARNGSYFDKSTGTKASVLANGATLDATQGGGAVIWSSLTPNRGTFRDDPDRLTISAIVRKTDQGSFTWITP